MNHQVRTFRWFTFSFSEHKNTNCWPRCSSTSLRNSFSSVCIFAGGEEKRQMSGNSHLQWMGRNNEWYLTKSKANFPWASIHMQLVSPKRKQFWLALLCVSEMFTKLLELLRCVRYSHVSDKFYCPNYEFGVEACGDSGNSDIKSRTNREIHTIIGISVVVGIARQ